MSGHSKWATIKRKKAVLDSKRGKEFTKIIKEITICAKQGGGDPTANPRLRTLLEKAKEVNMPLDNVQRAIKRGTGELPGVNYEEHFYEGYGPHGIAVIVEALTDNKNRTVSELRRLFSSKGGNLAEAGAVSWMFKQLGVIHAVGTVNEDVLLEALLELDIKDIAFELEGITIVVDARSLEKVKPIIHNLGLTVHSATVEQVAQIKITLEENDTERAYEFLSELDELDDVQNIYSNLGS